jgi:hypothetical protein
LHHKTKENIMKQITLCAVLALMLCGAATPARSATLGLQVAQLNAVASPVVLPSTPGFPCSAATTPCPSTGDLSISHRAGPIGTIDQASGTGSIYFPSSVNAPLFSALGIGPVNVTQAGNFFLSAMDNGLISVDIGFADLPTFGPVYAININILAINVSALQSGGPGLAAPGMFQDLTQEQYNRLLNGTLRGMLDGAMQTLQGVEPQVPSLPPSVLDAVKNLYDGSPSTELVLYFVNAAPGDQFRLSQLAGTATLALAAIPEPATLALLAAGLLALVRRRRHAQAERVG